MQPTDETSNNADGQAESTEVIRRKLDKLYQNEPDAKEEIEEVERMRPAGMSKHQRYMQELSGSGKSLAEIQTAWHEYYASLPDKEKHEVWQEFYAQHEREEPQEPTTEQTTPVRSQAPLSHNTAAL